MISIKKIAAATGVAATLALGLAAASPASAYVVCNGAGDCWHTDHRYAYGSDVQAQFYPDDWYFHHDWAHDNGHHWRDYHDGRGYYRGGVWIPF